MVEVKGEQGFAAIANGKLKRVTNFAVDNKPLVPANSRDAV
jgi:hypothetical protein